MKPSAARLTRWALLAVLAVSVFLVATWWLVCSRLESDGRLLNGTLSANSGRLGDGIIRDITDRWAKPGLSRSLLWLALTAPDWSMPGDARRIRYGARTILLVTGLQTGEAEQLLRVTGNERSDVMHAAVLLGAFWSGQSDGIDQAFRLLGGSASEQRIALLALPLVTGHRLSDCWDVLAFYLGDYKPAQFVEAVYGAPAGQVREEWLVWRGSHRGLDPGASHAEEFRKAVTASPEQPSDDQLEELVLIQGRDWSHLGVILYGYRPTFLADLEVELQGAMVRGAVRRQRAVWKGTLGLARAQLDQGLPPLDGRRVLHAIYGLP